MSTKISLSFFRIFQKLYQTVCFKKLSILLLLFLGGCSAKIDPKLQGDVSDRHKEITQKIFNRAVKCNKAKDGKLICRTWTAQRKKAPVGDSWQGNWVVTSLKKDYSLEKGVRLIKAKRNGYLNQLARDNSKSQIQSNEPVSINFLQLTPAFSSIDVSDGFLQRAQIVNIKEKNNALSWSVLIPRSNSSSLNRSYQLDTQAFYSPSTDTIKGTTNKSIVIKILKPDGQTISKKIPAATYNWEASRILPQLHGEFAKRGIFRTDLPHYFLDINFSESEAAKSL